MDTPDISRLATDLNYAMYHYINNWQWSDNDDLEPLLKLYINLHTGLDSKINARLDEQNALLKQLIANTERTNELLQKLK